MFLCKINPHDDMDMTWCKNPWAMNHVPILDQIGIASSNGFDWLCSYSASAEWWQCCCRRRKCSWTMRRPSFGCHRNGIRSGFCMRGTYSASPEWWECCCHRRQLFETMQHPSSGWGNGIRPGFCRRLSYSASPEWWECCCHRRQFNFTMQHPSSGWGNCFGDRGFFFSCCVAQCPKSWCCWHLYLAWLSWRWQFWPYCLVLSLSSMQHGYPAQAGWVSCGSVWVGHFSRGCWHGSCSCLACFCAANHLGTSAWLLTCYADPCMIYCWCRLRWPGFPPFCFGVDYWRVFWYLFRAF